MKIAFAGFGEINTPEEVLYRMCKSAADSLCGAETEIFAFYPIRDDAAEKTINAAVEYFSGKEFDAMVLCVAGWIPSHAVVKVLDKFRHVPMVLWGLCGWCDGERLVTTAAQAGTSALRKTLSDLGIKFKYVYDVVNKPSKSQEVLGFCRAARAYSAIRSARLGQMGYRDMQLYGTQFDALSLKKTVGAEIEFFEMLEVVRRAEKISHSALNNVVENRIKKWKFVFEPCAESVTAAARYYFAIKEIIDERGYEAVSLKDVDGFKKLLAFPPAPVFTLLGEDGLCTIPENDCLGNVTQVIVKKLTGQVGAYLEFYEFFDDGVLAGVPDYVPSEVIEGETVILPAAFGKFAEGLLNVSKIKTGELTLCRLTFTDGGYYMHVVKGEGVSPTPWEECGWSNPSPQLPGLKILLKDADAFAQNVMGQHYILSYGDNVRLIEDYCRIAGIGII